MFQPLATKRPSPLFKTNKATVEYFNGWVSNKSSQSWSCTKHTPLNEQISPTWLNNHYADIEARFLTKTKFQQTTHHMRHGEITKDESSVS